MPIYIAIEDKYRIASIMVPVRKPFITQLVINVFS